jgi:hypothetical protein
MPVLSSRSAVVFDDFIMLQEKEIMAAGTSMHAAAECSIGFIYLF